MQRAASYSKTISTQAPVLPSRNYALGGALLLVSLSYLLLLSVPSASSHLRAMTEGYTGSAGSESWLPIASVAGIALGGAAALLFVLMHIAREASRQPYIAMSPVLAAFAGCILIGLRAELPVPGVAPAHVAVFALAVAVVGGALAQEAGIASRLMGLLFTALPSGSLLLVAWTVSGKSDPWLALWSLPASTRAYLTMLSVSSGAIALLAVLGRRLVAEPQRESWSLAAQADAIMAETYAREESWAADEAALSRRGLPTWLVATCSAAAVIAGFFALRTLLDNRASLATKALVQPRTVEMQPTSAPLAVEARVAPALAQPTVTALVAPVVIEPSVPAVEAAPVAAALAPDSAEREETTRVLALERIVSEAPRSRRAHRRPGRAVAAPVAADSVKRTVDSKLEAKTEPLEAKPAKPEAKPAVVAREESPTRASEPVQKPKSSLADRLLAKPAAAKAPEKPVATRGDESLDELMDNVVKTKAKPKAGVGSTDDPIFGL